MVLIRFDEGKLLEFSGLPKDRLVKVPWLLGGEGKEENGDIVMEFNPDRPDLYSIQGVTRAIRAFDQVEKFSTQTINNEDLQVNSFPPKYRQYFSVGIVRGCRLKNLMPELIDFQEKIDLTVGRHRRLSSIGLHDLKKVKFPITYREVSRNEKFVPLKETEEVQIDGFVKQHPKAIEYGDLVREKIPGIIDSEGQIISLPPILNSAVTTVTEDTVDLLIDVEGTNKNAVDRTMVLVLTALSYPSGTISTLKLNDAVSPRLEYHERKISGQAVKKLLGYKLSEQEITTSLEKMGYGFREGNVVVPLYRTDIIAEVDIIEDIFKGLGYDRVQRRKEGFVSYGKENSLRAIESKLRHLLVGYDLNETVSSSLVNSRYNSVYGFNDNRMEILNPVSQEQDSIRTRMSPSLMQTFVNNFRNPYPQRIFEIGSVYVDRMETDVLGIGIADKSASFSEIKGIFVSVLEDLGIENYEMTRDEQAMYVPGRVAGISINGRKIGFFGEVHPTILKNIGIKMPVVMGEIDIREVMS
ncbi:MAG: phenylalanine--tRNA ligase subunit beta [Candidatus Thermoplasmatota archaeon]|jgi:phenylalanyl-tRNA synthetase beta chain|nr:phenylalanine--tRNA ligase subunit beta [Candidatus Thermoplasmatota archaeon]